MYKLYIKINLSCSVQQVRINRLRVLCKNKISYLKIVSN